MDSLHAPDSSIPSNIRFFLNYLFAEQLPETAPNFTSHLLPDFSIPVVQQDNSVDCGVYMLNNVKKLLLMSDAFEIRCNHNDAAAVQKAFQPLRLGGNEVKLLRRQIAGAIDGLARSLGKDEFEEEEEDSIEEVEVLEKAKTPEKRPVPPRRLSSSKPRGVVEKQLPVTAYLHTSQTEYRKSFDGLMGGLGKGVDPLTTLRTSTADRKRWFAVKNPKLIPGIDGKRVKVSEKKVGEEKAKVSEKVKVNEVQSKGEKKEEAKVEKNTEKERTEKKTEKSKTEKKWRINYSPINRLYPVCCNKEKKGTTHPTPSPAGDSRAAPAISPPSPASAAPPPPSRTPPRCAAPARTAE